jgi:hypothetical protein
MAIWQDLIDDHGFANRYASVRRFVAQLRGEPAIDARVVITTAPDEKAKSTTAQRRVSGHYAIPDASSPTIGST